MDEGRSVIQIRIPPEVKAAAQRAAAAQGRTLSNYLLWLIREDLKRTEGKAE